MWVQESEIDDFEKALEQKEDKETDKASFEKLCRENGIYPIRGTEDSIMIRVKIPLGILTPEQCEALADIAEKWTPLKQLHLTTRQSIQFHKVKWDDIPVVFRALANAGMTTREACGHTVRNVTLCPYAGVSIHEIFDPTPYALGLTKFLLRNPVALNLPRKFKIAFEGCSQDHSRPMIHDLGIVAVENSLSEEKGFRIFIGGGLGSHPRQAFLFEEFTPIDKLLLTVVSILKIFQRFGDRKTPVKARFKFVIEKWGIEEVRRLVLEERAGLVNGKNGSFSLPEVAFVEKLPQAGNSNGFGEDRQALKDGFLKWLEQSVEVQQQEGWNTVLIRCALGDLTAEQFRRIAAAAKKYSGGLRTTIDQNLLLRWIPSYSLRSVYQELHEAGLASPGDCLGSIVSCPGADTCRRAITSSRGLSRAISKELQKSFGFENLLEDLSIRISGCPNSCGQHHVGSVGLFGAAGRFQNQLAPYYQLLIGGRTDFERTQYGKILIKIPARKVPEAVCRLITWLKSKTDSSKKFFEVLNNTDEREIRRHLEPFQELTSPEQEPTFYKDWDSDEVFRLIGK